MQCLRMPSTNMSATPASVAPVHEIVTRQDLCTSLEGQVFTSASLILNRITGSVYDRIKVTKFNEFDINIVIRLPIDYTKVIMESKNAGFVKLNIGSEFDNLNKQHNWEKCHKVTREWRDANKYLLQNKFRQWIQSIVHKAINDLEGRIEVDGVVYSLKYKESGPAYTLNISNVDGEEKFSLDVDLVPVLKFRTPRWPQGFRRIESLRAQDWVVVPKPNKAIHDDALRNQCWRPSFQEFEREILNNQYQLKPAIRLVKKLRDALGLEEIASYYIKTLFLWKTEEIKEDTRFWKNKISVIFHTMVEELYKAIDKKEIPYFWHKDCNLLESLKPNLQKLYLEKLDVVLKRLKSNDVNGVVELLLTEEEMQTFDTTTSIKDSPHKSKTLNAQESKIQSEEMKIEKHRSIKIGSVHSVQKEDNQKLRTEIKSLSNDFKNPDIQEDKINVNVELLFLQKEKIKKLENEVKYLSDLVEQLQMEKGNAIFNRTGFENFQTFRSR